MKGKILIVEDNELNLKLFSDLLIYHNYEIITSIDGYNIPAIVEMEAPDIILMDIQLRSVSGIDIIKKLKTNEMTLKVPIIAVTAYAMKNDEKRILEAGCEAYLAKPVSINELFETIRNFIKLKETI